MIVAPWNLILTIVFVYTGVVLAISLIAWLRRPRVERRFDGEVLADVNHILMSAAMIWMSWSMESELALGLQVALFAALTVGLLLFLPGARTTTQRLDLGWHVVLNAAMIWMLAAMPLLMADMAMGHGTSTDHGMNMDMSGEGHPAMMGTPMWADVVNTVFVVLCVAVALWWVYRAVTAKGHRLHVSVHAVKGAGMAAMLVLMN
ncbi:DUF5134 domain-containing protein [Streptomyces rishiriensis]|uniref:DUF5134 domain-containing protein n=1 Tax=Actinomycetes TaxID=1760 RepID=UPI000B4E4B7E|nr:DUF5134 domain-containing protein [Micrococcus sp. FDAARGOS_333]PNL16946.1 DUF5134 domain-containing protein [Micrococcus sp. FDAARGOS_333]